MSTFLGKKISCIKTLFKHFDAWCLIMSLLIFVVRLDQTKAKKVESNPLVSSLNSIISVLTEGRLIKSNDAHLWLSLLNTVWSSLNQVDLTLKQDCRTEIWKKFQTFESSWALMNLEFVIQFYTFPSCNTPEKKHSSQKGAATLGFAYRADGSPPLVATKKTTSGVRDDHIHPLTILRILPQ